MENPKDRRHGADMSHRGGKPGFVKIEEDGSFIFPEFSGNNHYNTLGNLNKNPVAGLLFQDFETGHLLQLTCSVEILWDDERIQDFQGALRFVRFQLDEGVLIENGMPMRWNLFNEAIGVPQSGSWEEVTIRQRSREVLATRWRTLRVARVKTESNNINSYHLEPVDQKPLQPFEAGQFLPIRVLSPSDAKPIYRSYSLSGKPGEPFYRLSIKREEGGPNRPPGLVSNLFHESMKPGSLLEALKPQGEFVIDQSAKRPLVLLSAGVGITPMVSMIQDMPALHHERKIWFLHGTQNSKTHAFREDIQALKSPGRLTVHTRYSQPLPEDVRHKDYQDVGRLDINLLKSLLPFDDYDFYLCGPEGFMKGMYASLRGMNIAADRIHHEFFGKGSIHEEAEAEKQSPIKVQFKTSQKEATWKPGKGNLLDLAEKVGLEPPTGCRSGACLTCVTKILSGGVTHSGVAKHNAPKNSALICSATPNSKEPLVLDL